MANEGNRNNNFNVLIPGFFFQHQQLLTGPHIYTKSAAHKKCLNIFSAVEHLKLLKKALFYFFAQRMIFVITEAKSCWTIVIGVAAIVAHAAQADGLMDDILALVENSTEAEIVSVEREIR